MSGNKHRWKLWIEKWKVELLDEATLCLSEAWAADARDQKHYPLNSDSIISEVKRILRNDAPREIHNVAKRKKPQRLSDLLSEEDIKFIYEDHNSGSYEDALVAVWEADETKSPATFQKILRAMEKAYLLRYGGPKSLPAPRVHFLHRGLLEIAELAGQGDLTREGIAEFLDDVCPCGKKHTPEAIRKLRKRLP